LGGGGLAGTTLDRANVCWLVTAVAAVMRGARAGAGAGGGGGGDSGAMAMRRKVRIPDVRSWSCEDSESMAVLSSLILASFRASIDLR
jgi:hypothetical protein